MIYSCCTTMEHYDRVKQAGYDRIILSAVDLMSMGDDEVRKIKSKISNDCVKCSALNNFCTGDLKLCGPDFDIHLVREYCLRLMERSAVLGIKNIGVGAPLSRSIPDGYQIDRALEEIKQSLSVACIEAAKFGQNILLEAVCDMECNFITTTDEAFAIVQSLNVENIHLVYDTYHASKMNENELPLLKAFHEVKLIHVAQDIEETRRFPQEDFLDGQRVYFDALCSAGYNGEISVEADPINLEEELKNTLQILKTLCGEAG